MATAELSDSTKLVEVQANPLELYQTLISQGTDPDKLRGLLDLYERWEDRQADKQYSAAMKACQDEIKQLHIKPDRKNTHTGSWYAQLERISKMIDPICNRHGFSLSFDTEEHVQPDKMWIVCDCRHDAGHKHRYRLPLALDQFGPQGKATKTPVQAAVSSVTTGRRCLKCMVFDVVIEGMDNDGNREEETISDGDARALEQMLIECNADIDAFKTAYQINRIADLPKTQLGNARAQILRKKERQNASR